jgi:O-antigen/teichoic acid export membrane protein
VDLIPRFVGEFGITTLLAQVVIFAIGAIAGIAEVGALRAGQLLLGPLNVIFLGVSLVGLPEGVRALRVSTANLRRKCVIWSAGLAACAICVGIFGLLLPDRLGTALLGESWPAAQQVVLPLSIGLAGSGVILGAAIGLRALAAARLSLRARLSVAPLILTGALAGAAFWGAQGAAVGFAIAYPMGSIIWWRHLRLGLREHDADSSFSTAQRVEADRAEGSRSA